MLDYYRDQNCMKKFCKDLKKHAEKIINCKRKEMLPLIYEENDFYENQKVCHICKKEFIFDIDSCGKNMYIKYRKVKDHCHYTEKYRGAAHTICNLRFKTPKEIPIAFHNGLTYDYHFIIRKLAKEFEEQLECLGENAQKYITFSVPIKKQLDNNFRFASTSLSILVNNLSEGLHNDKCIECKSYLDYMSIKDDQLILTCFKCKKIYEKDLNNDLMNRFAST